MLPHGSINHQSTDCYLWWPYLCVNLSLYRMPLCSFGHVSSSAVHFFPFLLLLLLLVVLVLVVVVASKLASRAYVCVFLFICLYVCVCVCANGVPNQTKPSLDQILGACFVKQSYQPSGKHFLACVTACLLSFVGKLYIANNCIDDEDDDDDDGGQGHINKGKQESNEYI